MHGDLLPAIIEGTNQSSVPTHSHATADGADLWAGVAASLRVSPVMDLSFFTFGCRFSVSARNEIANGVSKASPRESRDDALRVVRFSQIGV